MRILKNADADANTRYISTAHDYDWSQLINTAHDYDWSQLINTAHDYDWSQLINAAHDYDWSQLINAAHDYDWSQLINAASDYDKSRHEEFLSNIVHNFSDCLAPKKLTIKFFIAVAKYDKQNNLIVKKDEPKK